MTVMTIVFEPSEQVSEALGRAAGVGTVSDNFIAVWAEGDGSLHFTVCVTPELAHVGDAIEELLRKAEYGPVMDVLKLPRLDAGGIDPEELGGAS